MGTQLIVKRDNLLLLEYDPEFFESFNQFMETCDYYENEGKTLFLKKTFHIKRENILLNSEISDTENDFPALIVIGKLNETGNYYQLDRNVFDLDFDVFFDSQIVIKIRYFCYENSSVIRYLSNTLKSDVYIDKENIDQIENHITIEEFEECIVKIPTQYELKKYKDKVTSELFQEHFGNLPDYKSKYENYVNKLRAVSDYKEKMPKDFFLFKIEEYKGILSELKRMLNDRTLTEKQWQNKIIDILKIIFPKYIYFFSSVNIFSLGDKRQLDYLAVDNQGNVDVIEIKKAEIGKLLRLYRNNYSPTKELAGSFTQVEKYIYYLSSDKQSLEKKLNDTFGSDLGNLKIKIINPQGIIIAGRGNNMSDQEKQDFEIVRKAHKDISDVITYDDLITRLENTISAFEERKKSSYTSNEVPF